MKANNIGMARIIVVAGVWLAAAGLAQAGTHSATSGRVTVDTRIAGVAGRVTGTNGIGLAAATVSALQGGVARKQVATDANGYYALASLPNGVYDLRAEKTNYLPGTLYVVHLAAGTTAARNFTLVAKPAVPLLVETNLPRPTVTIVPITSDQLKIYSGGAFTGGSIDRDKMTVVFTHGWNSDPTVWATDMVEQMKAGGFTNANFVAWNWSNAAASSVSQITKILNKTPGQGNALGQALADALGTSYGKPIHFIGHSFGTIVNAKAANFIHGTGLFSPALTHCTLLDDGEGVNGFPVPGDPSIMFTGPSVPSIYPVENYDPIPEAASTWVDSYISAFGRLRADAVDGVLVQATDRVPSNLGAEDRIMLLHRYAATWYALTTANPSGSAMGFANSFEKNGPSWNPASSAPGRGENYRQNYTGAELPMVSIDDSVAGAAWAEISLWKRNVLSIAGVAASRVGAVVSGTVGAALDVVVSHVAAPDPAFVTTPAFSSQSGLRDMPIYSFEVTLQSPDSSGPLKQPDHSGVQLRDAGGESNQPCIWLPISIPADAAAFSFDFTFRGDPGEDVLVASLAGTNVVELEAKYIPTNQTCSSGSIPVGDLAGKNVELVFGLLGGTSSNASVTVDAMRFYSLTPPNLTIAPDGSTNVPAEASTGLVLAVAANVAWAATTNSPWLSIASGEWGEGDGTVVYNVAANGTASARTGTITVAGGGISRTCTVVQAAIFYRDADGDGYGDPNVSTTGTAPPAGYVANNTDWNDSNASVYPGAPEVGDGVDNNGNGQIDEGARDLKTCFALDQSIRSTGAGWSRTFVMDLTNFRDLVAQDGYQSYTVNYLLYYNIWTGIYLYGYDSGKFDAVTWSMNLDL